MLDTIKAVVTAKQSLGEGNYFWICSSKAITRGSVIFYPNTWISQREVHIGARVALSNLEETNKGWRAYSARFWQPSDEQSQ